MFDRYDLLNSLMICLSESETGVKNVILLFQPTWRENIYTDALSRQYSVENLQAIFLFVWRFFASRNNRELDKFFPRLLILMQIMLMLSL